MPMINCDSELGTRPGPVVTTGLRAIETAVPNGDTEKENSSLCINDERRETCLLLKTEEVKEKLCSRMQDKMDLPKNVGLSQSNANDDKISDERKAAPMGETCNETHSIRTKIVEEKLCSTVQDKMDFQAGVGLSESVANDEMISDETSSATIGESDKCLEADVLRTEEAEGDLSSITHGKVSSLESFGSSESDVSGEQIRDEINDATPDGNKTGVEVNENECDRMEDNVKQVSKDVAQSADVLFNDLEKPISDFVPVPDGGNAAKVYCVPSAETDKTFGTNVNLTSTPISCQTSAANLNRGIARGKITEVIRTANNYSNAASRLVVIKNKNDFSVSRSPSVTPASVKTFLPTAKLLHDIGIDLVTEWVCHDLIQTQATTRSPLTEAEKSRQLSVLTANKQRLAKRNKAFAFYMSRCRCGFCSESQNVMAFHSQFGGVSRNGYVRCCLCSFATQNSLSFTRHMKRRHKLKALVTAKVAQYQCHFCPFENRHQTRLEGHLVRCSRLFNANFNLCPVRMDCDIPLYVTTRPLLAGELLAKQITVTSVSGPGSHVFPFGGETSRMPLHSNVPSGSLIMQQPQQCATIPSSVTLSLPLTHFIVTPSMSPGMPQLQLSVVPPKSQNSTQPCSVVSPVVSPFLPYASGQTLALPRATQNSLQRNLMMSSSQRSLALPQNFSQTGLTIPPLLRKDAPQSLMGVPPSATLGQPEPRLFVPPGVGSDLLRMQLLASGAGTRFFQVGNQMCTVVQHQGRSVLTPVIFPRPILPLAPSFALNPPPRSRQPTVSSRKQNVTKNSAQLSSNIAAARDNVSFVRLPKLQPSPGTNQVSYTLEICELCEGFVKDRQSLSTHFRNAHAVFVYDLDCVVPTQRCSLCMQSFFTISGLLRHYHLVHASDSRLIRPLQRCSLCQDINVENVVEHLKTHHLDRFARSYEFKDCGICSLHLRDIHSFEKHMLVVHENLFANRNILLATIAASYPDKTRWASASSPPGLDSQPKKGSKKPGKAHHTCKTCGTIRLTAEELNNHIIADHMHKCSRCKEAFNCLPALRRHFFMKHSTQREACPLCLKTVQIGRPFIRHMKSQHLKDCSVKIERIHDSNALANQTERRTINSVELGNSVSKQATLPVGNRGRKSVEDRSSRSAKRRKLESD